MSKVMATTGETTADARAAEAVDVDGIQTQNRCLHHLRNL
jgi:hypothetical protein